VRKELAGLIFVDGNFKMAVCMKASVLVIGDEILNGNTQDTNSSFIASVCNNAGIKVFRTMAVSDTYDAIHRGLQMVAEDADVVFITGGLGPTKDDITLKSLADYFGRKLVFNQQVYEQIRAFFEKRGKEQLKMNEKLAYLPEDCRLMPNERGTAMGMWFEHQGKVFVSMPGVPYEMKHMFVNHVLPAVKEQFQIAPILNRYIMTAGIGESAIAEKIADIESALPSYISLAYLPSLSRVKLRLTAGEFSEQVEKEIHDFQHRIAERLPGNFYSFDEDKMIEEVLGEMLSERNETLSTAESCTGGFIAHKITSVSGSSRYYEGSVISYSNEIKKNHLGVKETTLTEHGAVSEATVREMLHGLIESLNTTYGIAVSGIAGPGGGTPQKPVGTVWMAVGTKEKQVVRKYQLTPHRFMNIEITAVLALNLLRRFMLNDIEEAGFSRSAIN
jgi:nicotinamide-nucleotide amidase